MCCLSSEPVQLQILQSKSNRKQLPFRSWSWYTLSFSGQPAPYRIQCGRLELKSRESWCSHSVQSKIFNWKKRKTWYFGPFLMLPIAVALLKPNLVLFFGWKIMLTSWLSWGSNFTTKSINYKSSNPFQAESQNRLASFIFGQTPIRRACCWNWSPWKSSFWSGWWRYFQSRRWRWPARFYRNSVFRFYALC